MSSTSKIPFVKLNTGATMPALGLGSWMGQPGTGENEECYDMVMNALKLGYRHIDTAYGYRNEEAVGRAIRDSGVPREEIFVTTKLTGVHHGSVAEGFETSLKALGVGYIDLYLVHWPQATDPETKKPIPYGQSPTIVETWKDMEKLLEDKDKRCRAIGVSNFSVKLLEILAKETTVVPAVDQVESHPYLPQESLDKYCREKGIVLTAYSPLGQPRPKHPSPVLMEPVALKLAEKYNKPVGTVGLVAALISRSQPWLTSALPLDLVELAYPERLDDCAEEQ